MTHYLTKYGMAAFRKKLAMLEQKLDESLKNAGEAAQNSSNSYHDNFEYEEGMRQQEMLSRQISELWKAIQNVRIADEPADDKQIAMGHFVTVRFDDRSTPEQLILCGEGEGALFENACSPSSPLGQALLGMTSGAKKTFSAGGRDMQIEVLAIRKAEEEDFLMERTAPKSTTASTNAVY